MRRALFASALACLVLVAAANVARAEVKSVHMHIAGYLCGN